MKMYSHVIAPSYERYMMASRYASRVYVEYMIHKLIHGDDIT